MVDLDNWHLMETSEPTELRGNTQTQANNTTG